MVSAADQELELEAATCRVFLAAAADAVPKLTKDEVRCIVEGSGSIATEMAVLYDEPEAINQVWRRKLALASQLVATSSAGQSTQAQGVFDQCLRMVEITTPYHAA